MKERVEAGGGSANREHEDGVEEGSEKADVPEGAATRSASTSTVRSLGVPMESNAKARCQCLKAMWRCSATEGSAKVFSTVFSVKVLSAKVFSVAVSPSESGAMARRGARARAATSTDKNM